MIKKVLVLFILTTGIAQAEVYQCAYSWNEMPEVKSMQIIANGDRAAVIIEDISAPQKVLINNEAQLILYNDFGAVKPAPDNIVGIMLIVLDKGTGEIAQSNMIAGANSDALSSGSCQRIK